MLKSRFLRKLIILGIILGLFLTLLISFRVSTQVSHPQTLTVAVAETPPFAIIFIADSMGYFKDENLKIDFHKYLLGRDAIKDLVTNDADLATVYDIPFILNIYQGHDLKTLTTLHQTNSHLTISAYKSSRIDIPQDLSHKKIAFNKGTGSEYLLYLYLKEQGIDVNSVQLIDVPPDTLITALDDHLVDAAVLYQPYLYMFTQKNESKDITLFQTDSYTESSLLVGKTDYIKNNPDVIIRFLRALYRAELFIKSDKQTSQKLVGAWLRNTNEKAIRDIWDQFNYSMKLDNILIMNLEREAAFFHDNGTYPQGILNLRKYIFTDYLQFIKPEGVTIY